MTTGPPWEADRGSRSGLGWAGLGGVVWCYHALPERGTEVTAVPKLALQGSVPPPSHHDVTYRSG